MELLQFLAQLTILEQQIPEIVQETIAQEREKLISEIRDKLFK